MASVARRICFILIYPVHQNARIQVQCVITVALYDWNNDPET